MTTVLTVGEEGLLIPRSMLPSDGEWVVNVAGREITLHPRLSPAQARQRMREISDRLREKYGDLPDSTPLLRGERDR
jgi:hypothetical protein